MPCPLIQWKLHQPRLANGGRVSFHQVRLVRIVARSGNKEYTTLDAECSDGLRSPIDVWGIEQPALYFRSSNCASEICKLD